MRPKWRKAKAITKIETMSTKNNKTQQILQWITTRPWQYRFSDLYKKIEYDNFCLFEDCKSVMVGREEARGFRK